MTTVRIDDIYWHAKFGFCRVVSFDSRGLVMVKWPEYSASQSYWSLVEPNTLKGITK